MAGIKGFVAVIGEAFRNLLRPNVTVMYPLEHVPIPEGFRGAPEVDPELCTVCGRCEKECPSHSITITGPVTAPNTPDDMEAYEFAIQLASCMFCQTCEEFCPQGKKDKAAIRLTQRYELANYNTKDTIEVKIVYKKKRIAKES